MPIALAALRQPPKAPCKVKTAIGFPSDALNRVLSADRPSTPELINSRACQLHAQVRQGYLETGQQAYEKLSKNALFATFSAERANSWVLTSPQWLPQLWFQKF
jgi:hypothetical protein